ncbi:Sedlin [Astrocystis sublimbata]|nr:Sedlin [Astrocystis sublimbata]
MAQTVPSIACLGVIGRNNNPLHITIFPSFDSTTRTYVPVRTPLQFSLLLSGTLDVFETRARQQSHPGGNPASGPGSLLLSGDFGLLHAIDDRLAAYGFETNTGVKFVAVVDLRGRSPSILPSGNNNDNNNTVGAKGGSGGIGLRDNELKPVFRAMQTAYVRLLQNPFYDPDETTVIAGAKPGGAAKRITSRKFADEMRKIGELWAPGVATL